MSFLNEPNVLAPMLALVLWSLVVWVWMYATRIPAMLKSGLDPQAARFPGSLDVLPDKVRQVADNYNHLFEQPTIFYALAVYTYLSATVTPLTCTLAWAYVGLRVVHSLVQGTINIVNIRFLVFAASTLALIAWALIEVSALLNR